ncbi:histone lysine demethylase PHF8-like isoform X2 [Ischnura elegans]|uniref:histone lysine demethylase PHF8-like isoform X2 n=1 Tax=Ischnura elegans TaxID=197161 RepID=UPI001ED8A843|nr:histone lysine demethylase PHF8-like isoform X2 [Ischnura elegans]
MELVEFYSSLKAVDKYETHVIRSCIDLEEYMAVDLDKYHCPRCTPFCGPSVQKKRTNRHRNNIYELNADNKPVQSGTPVFIEELRSRHFPSADDITLKMHGQQLTVQYLQRTGFNDPILIPHREGLGMTVPADTFSVSDVEYYVGSERKVDVIEVTNQTGIRMKLGEFVKYFKKPKRTKVLNLISLEFTGTPLSSLVEAPYIARKLDWLNQVWPADPGDDENLIRPQVEKYCLMSVKDSYTDFHVDFGGTSVWYHLLWGEKIFYLIKPTPANLSLYQRWTSSSTQSETFFGDQVDMCYKFTLRQGQTLIIPTGWIHAVLTPLDSLVFGGNFLHSLNIPMQLQVYEIEHTMRMAKKYLYPSFQKVNWFAARGLLGELKRVNDSGSKCPSYLLTGLKALVLALKQWSQDKDLSKHVKEDIPLAIDAHKLLKELNKEIRHAERFINSLNPPKPERESKRKKRKPANEDFVDITQSIALTGFDEFIDKGLLKSNLKSPVKKKEPIQLVKEKPKSPIKLTLTKPPLSHHSPGAAISYTVTPKIKKPENVTLSEIPDSLGKPWSVSLDSNLHLKIKTKVKRPKITSSLAPKEKEKNMARKKLENVPERSPANYSIYDFHDDSDGDSLMIDENPGKIRRQTQVDSFSSSKQKSPHFFVVNGESEHVPEMEVAGEVDVVSDIPKNGIEELLKASVLTSVSTKDHSVEEESEEEEQEIEIISSSSSQEAGIIGDNSHSVVNSAATRDAIAGMLSFSRALDAKPKAPSYDSSPAKSKKEVRVESSSDEDEEQINNVHQDDDFIYPTLDLSDDEDDIIRARIVSKKMDEAWSPRARVGPVMPKTNRPVREGKKRTAVEKGLEAAAAKRANLPTPKRQYLKKKIKKVVESKTASSDSLIKPPITKAPKKPKKGMATAKQRLGKILKIHKMLSP